MPIKEAKKGKLSFWQRIKNLFTGSKKKVNEPIVIQNPVNVAPNKVTSADTPSNFQESNQRVQPPRQAQPIDVRMAAMANGAENQERTPGPFKAQLPPKGINAIPVGRAFGNPVVPPGPVIADLQALQKDKAPTPNAGPAIPQNPLPGAVPLQGVVVANLQGLKARPAVLKPYTGPIPAVSHQPVGGFVKLPINTVPVPKNLSFKNWLAALSPERATILSQALQDKNKQFNFFSLSPEFFRGMTAAEKADFDFVLATNTIEYLGGGNSKNFLVTNVLTGNKEVLKLEYRMGNPIDQVQKLQKNAALSPYFVGVSHNRAVAIGTNRGSDIRFLQMTDFCQGDDLTSCAYKVESDISRLISANNIYSQMAHVLVNLDANNTIHTDMKNSNWLLDEQGRLRIADTKAFVPTEKGNFSRSIARKNKYDLVTTSYLNPPEFAFDAPFSASKAQAYMFGKNLYDFLSAYDYHKKSGSYNYEAIKQAKNGEDLNFDAPIFSTPIGERYKQLICEAVRANPNERLDMRGVQESMQAIESLLKKPEILNEYYEIRSALQRQAKSVNSTQNIRDNINYMFSVWDDKTLEPWLNDEDFTLLNKQMSLYSDMLKIVSRININSLQQDKLQVIMENFYEGKENIAGYKEAFYKIVNLEIETQASSDPVKADYMVLVNQLETVRDKGNVNEELERAARGVYEKPTTENFESINKRLAGLLSSMQPYLTQTAAHSATETTRWMKSNMQNCRQQSAANAVDASELVQPTGNKLIH